MKRNLLTLLAIFLFLSGYAQTSVSRSEDDSLECLKNYSLYSLSLKKKMYSYALEPWRKMFENCPDISTRIYSDGITLYTHFIKNSDDLLRKEELVDTLLMIYDQRINYFGSHEKYSEGWILGRKGWIFFGIGAII